MWLFYLFALVAILLGISSLKGGFDFLAYVRPESANETMDFSPFASIIAPCRGLDQGLYENLRALFEQDYGPYEILFVTDSDRDPALAVIKNLRESFADSASVASYVVIAGEAIESGQKVHNLRAGIKEVNPSSEIFVFVDTDARPHARWLRSLVAPLEDERIGAATGYRWFIPVRGGFWSQMRSVWNASIASALGANEEKNFCWGGSTAIRRETFERLNMRERWRGTLSDDFALTRALQQAKLPIKFVPQCLTASLGDCGFTELLEFTTRQLKITRVYASHLWRAVLLGSTFFVLTFFGGVTLVIARAVMGRTIIASLLLLAIIYALGSAKSYLRWKAISLTFAEYRNELRPGFFAHLFLWPLATLIYFYNALAAGVSRKIVWRGVTYRLKSPTETEIIKSDNRQMVIGEGK